MNPLIQKVINHPALLLGSAALWGILEFFALQRLRRDARRRSKRGAA